MKRSSDENTVVIALSYRRELVMILLVPVLAFPGSIAFANWDAPYGFYKDFSTWLGSTVGGWLLLLPYSLFA